MLTKGVCTSSLYHEHTYLLLRVFVQAVDIINIHIFYHGCLYKQLIS